MTERGCFAAPFSAEGYCCRGRTHQLVASDASGCVALETFQSFLLVASRRSNTQRYNVWMKPDTLIMRTHGAESGRIWIVTLTRGTRARYKQGRGTQFRSQQHIPFIFSTTTCSNDLRLRQLTRERPLGRYSISTSATNPQYPVPLYIGIYSQTLQVLQVWPCWPHLLHVGALFFGLGISSLTSASTWS